jgi:hypothetical protein
MAAAATLANGSNDFRKTSRSSHEQSTAGGLDWSLTFCCCEKRCAYGKITGCHRIQHADQMCHHLDVPSKANSLEKQACKANASFGKDQREKDRHREGEQTGRPRRRPRPAAARPRRVRGRARRLLRCVEFPTLA